MTAFLKYFLLLLLIIRVQVSNGQCFEQLVWQDEFDGNTLDLNKWAFDLGDGCPSLCGWGNNELVYYTQNNHRLQGGNLVIEVKKENLGGGNFSSTKLITRNKFSQTYGRFEGRIKLPKGRGLWPAFWMLSTGNNWPMTGEIDIMEYRGDIPQRTFGTVHYGSPWPNNQYDGTTYDFNGDLSADFHIYVVEWEPNFIRWYFDGNLFKTITRVPNNLNPQSTNNVWPWNTNFYMILNTAVGGWFTGTTDQNLVALTKPTMEVDYIRVYSYQTSTTSQLPYLGTINFPVKIEAENFDKGCTNAFNDADNANRGGAYRNTPVDIEPCTDAGLGYNVGYVSPGEWLEYTVNIPVSGVYNFTFRVASNVNGSRFRLEQDGVNVSGSINVNSTGGWQSWSDVTANNINLTAGTRVLRIFFEQGEINLNNFNATSFPLNIEIEQKEPLLTQYQHQFTQINNRFAISHKEEFSCTIYDITGKILYDQPLLMHHDFLLETKGIYFAKTLTNNDIQTYKLVVD